MYVQRILFIIFVNCLSIEAYNKKGLGPPCTNIDGEEASDGSAYILNKCEMCTCRWNSVGTCHLLGEFAGGCINDTSYNLEHLANQYYAYYGYDYYWFQMAGLIGGVLVGLLLIGTCHKYICYLYSKYHQRLLVCFGCRRRSRPSSPARSISLTRSLSNVQLTNGDHTAQPMVGGGDVRRNSGASASDSPGRPIDGSEPPSYSNCV